MRKAIHLPTDTELAILRALWELGPATVRQVYHHLVATHQDLNYPAVLRMMQLMADKGQVLRDQQERSHVYRPAQKKEQVQGSLVEDLLDRAFGGDALDLLTATLSRRKMSPAEREEATQLISRETGKRS